VEVPCRYPLEDHHIEMYYECRLHSFAAAIVNKGQTVTDVKGLAQIPNDPWRLSI